MIAWKGAGNDNISVALVSRFADSQGNFGIEGLTNKVILGETSSNAPALASDGRRLFLAWKGSGNDNLNTIVSLDDGASFSGKYTSPETSDAGVSLVGSALPFGSRTPSSCHRLIGNETLMCRVAWQLPARGATSRAIRLAASGVTLTSRPHRWSAVQPCPFK